MAMRSVGQVPRALVLVALAVVVASGQGLTQAQAARNETDASANGEALDALLSTTSRAFSKSACVESIRIMKYTSTQGVYPEIDFSFPPDSTFIPPGAEAWCDCLGENEPVRGIPSDFEGVFDTCRDQVLVNSDYNAMDMCRGMVRIYGYDFWYSYTTFCSRQLCASNNYYRRTDRTALADAFDLRNSCADSCMAELSAGYCAKYRLTYGGFVSYIEPGSLSPRGSFRKIVVDGRWINSQSMTFDSWSHRKVPAAEAICNALYPTEPKRCCTYERGYATLSQCCYVQNGELEFNCGKSYGGDRLRYNCVHVGSDPYDKYYGPFFGFTRLHDACNVLIDYYVAHPTYRQATLAKILTFRPGTSLTSVVFPEAFMDDFCASSDWYDLQGYRGLYLYYTSYFTPGTREYCCNKLIVIFGSFLENCLEDAGSHESLGATRLPPSVDGPQQTPSPSLGPPPASCDACSYVNEKGDCESVCKDGQECAVRRGKAVCVRCDYFRQEFPDGKDRQCCERRGGDSGTLCQSKVNNKGEKNKCFTNEGPWTNDKGAVRNPQPYTIDAVRNVCNARRNFWVNRKLCKVKIKPNGEKRCKYISKRKRSSILTGR